MREALVITSTLPEHASFNYDLFDVLDELDVGHTSISYLEAPDKTDQLREASRIIVSGVPFSYPVEAADVLKVHMKPWLPDLKVPSLNICLGHQAMGMVFGALMREPDEEVEIGTFTAEVEEDQQDDPLIKDLGRRFDIECLHRASISIKYAPQLVRIAHSLPKPGISPGCRNQIVKVKGKQIYGTQFHPERSEDGKKLLKNFFELPLE